MRDIVKGVAFGVALLLVLPALISFQIRRIFLGGDRAFQSSTQSLSLCPGLLGQYVRRAFLWLVLDHCARSVTIEFGTIFSQLNVRLEENVYVGPGCHLGSVWLERDVLVAAGVHIPSGAHTHGSADVSRPIREQPGTLRTVRIGAGTWIGSAAVVMADVGANSMIAAGAVVVEAVPDNVIAGGVPARVLKQRV